MNLHLPSSPIPDRVSFTGALPANHPTTYAQPDGPGRIHSICVVPARPERLPLSSRKATDSGISYLNTLPKMGDK